MSHQVETMAYAGELPWHGLGVPVSNDMSAYEMMEAAQLNWTVKKQPMYFMPNEDKGILVEDKMLLIREEDNKQLDVVGRAWHPVQNQEAFDFFYDWVEEGNMEMHTAGSLKDGKLVWVLAKINETFEVLRNDIVEGYLLFTNPHQFGHSINVRFTPIRVVCNNTLQLALGGNNNSISVDHTKQFDAHAVKDALGLSRQAMAVYGDKAKYLAQTPATNEAVDNYLRELFPLTKYQEERGDTRSRRARQVRRLYHQGTPGSDLAKETWWDAFNTVTYAYDHKFGNNNAARMQSSWYGTASNAKQEALSKAIDFANAA
tara:strand:+ start:1086 stop:2033 length:948 start_codon:yes stop_codon:yes gene_type:complete